MVYETRRESDARRIDNPILMGMSPDPSALVTDEGVWIVNSSFEFVPGLPLSFSTDLVDWRHAGYAINLDMARRLHLDAVTDSGGVYAPTLRRIAGRYVIACTICGVDEAVARAHGADSCDIQRMRNAGGNFVITAPTIGGRWDGPFWIEGAEGIDPDIFQDEDGSVWWTQTRPAGKPMWHGQTEIWTRRLDVARWKLVGQEHVLWHGAMENVVWSEGPHLVRRGEYVYLFAAEGGTGREHSEAVARAHKPEGPFIGNNKNPILTHRTLGERYPVQNVGHCDLFEFPRGTWNGVCLASREIEQQSYFGRETYLFDVVWQDDDWPVFAPGSGKLPSAIYAAQGAKPYTGTYGPANMGSDIWHVFRDSDQKLIYPRAESDRPSVRIDGDDFLAVIPANRRDAEIQIRQNSQNSVIARSDGNGQIEFVVVAHGRTRVIWHGDGTEVGHDGVPVVIGLRLRRGQVSLVMGRAPFDDMQGVIVATYRRLYMMGTVLVGERTLSRIDASFLSTEYSGGFVGCRVECTCSPAHQREVG